ncbi:MAG: adenine phosphoribosyltransferase [Candidatus Omnitrophica bacterium]|nr:adenine phosphoribosyltransferase [Candidatus Omnitrophota bacterium]
MAGKLQKKDLKSIIRDVPDFPKKGIIFKDITTLLKNKEAFKKAVDLLSKKFKKEKIDYVVAVESRGFIFGAAIAYKLNAGFIPVRKKGKLPYKTKSVSYELEYGTDTLEMHEDALSKGAKVLVVDDLLATGGTIRAVCDLVKGQGAKIVAVAFLIELRFLKGSKKLNDVVLYSVIKY